MTTTSNGGADLQALMGIADRYARRLVTDVTSPTAVLLVERAGELDVVVLDGEGLDVIPQVRLLVARSSATSVALLIELSPCPAGTSHAGFWVLGEDIEGATAGRCYRLRPCGKARRLTPLVDGDDSGVEGLFRPLFPAHLASGNAGGAASAAAPQMSDDAAPAATTERIVAA